MKKLFLMGICLFTIKAWALEAHLNPNPIMRGESVELSISSDKPVTAPENLKELTQNFLIAGSQQRQSSQFVNGVGSTTYETAFVLHPLKGGEIQIPALKIGNEKTAPLTLKVLDKAETKEKQADLPTLELVADVSNQTPYEGQTIFYTLTLTDGQGLIGGEIIPAKVENARLNQIGQDKTESVIKNGQRVHEISRSYTLTPDKAGKIEIPPALFNGEVSYKAQRPSSKRKFFGIADADLLFGNFFNTTRPVSFTSNPVMIEVQPKPGNVKGWWLPSTKVELMADYQIPQIVQVGDTISGIFILRAQDVDASNMPVPRLNNSADFRLYPKPEERTTSLQEGHLLGQVSMPFTLIPLKAGPIEIPEVSVSWFNTMTKKWEKATVPARPLTVEESSIAPVIASHAEASIPPKEVPAIVKEPPKSWMWLALGLGVGVLFSAFVVGLIFLYKHLRQKKKEKPLPDFYPFK